MHALCNIDLIDTVLMKCVIAENEKLLIGLLLAGSLKAAAWFKEKWAADSMYSFYFSDSVGALLKRPL